MKISKKTYFTAVVLTTATLITAAAVMLGNAGHEILSGIYFLGSFGALALLVEKKTGCKIPFTWQFLYGAMFFGSIYLFYLGFILGMAIDSHLTSMGSMRTIGTFVTGMSWFAGIAGCLFSADKLTKLNS